MIFPGDMSHCSILPPDQYIQTPDSHMTPEEVNDLLTNTEYELDFRRKLRAELQRYLAGQKSDIDILSAIMRRNKISVQRIYRNVQAAATDQGRFETSISGKKSIDDAVNELKAFKIAARPVESIRKKKSVRGNVETVLITNDGIEQAYKYSGLSESFPKASGTSSSSVRTTYR